MSRILNYFNRGVSYRVVIQSSVKWALQSRKFPLKSFSTPCELSKDLSRTYKTGTIKFHLPPVLSPLHCLMWCHSWKSRDHWVQPPKGRCLYLRSQSCLVLTGMRGGLVLLWLCETAQLGWVQSPWRPYRNGWWWGDNFLPKTGILINFAEWCSVNKLGRWVRRKENQNPGTQRTSEDTVLTAQATMRN